MGTITAASFAFFFSAAILLSFQPQLVEANISIRALILTSHILHFGAYFLLILPAIINVVLTIVWRETTVPELSFERRCHLDVDFVWSVSSATCSPPSWTSWIVLAIIRLLLTTGCAVRVLDSVYIPTAHTVNL